MSSFEWIALGLLIVLIINTVTDLARMSYENKKEEIYEALLNQLVKDIVELKYPDGK